MSLSFSEKLSRIPHYEAGMHIEVAREKYGLDEIVKLASNESPFPPVAAAVDAAHKALATVNRYPDPVAAALRQALADRYELRLENIAVGNGSCDLLLAAADALLGPERELIYAWPSFSIYPHMTALADCKELRAELDSDFKHDLDGMAAVVKENTAMIVVCNPNNPTGTYIESGKIAEFMLSVPQRVCVILDEAYIELQTVEDPDNSVDLLKEFPNLVILRTFSKVYGLSGLRAGYALCSDELRHAFNQVRQPFTVNSAAQAAATEALRHQDDVVDRVEKNAIERIWVEDQLGQLGIKYAESQSNFSWIDLSELGESYIVEGLAERGVIVRPGTALGAPGYMRVSFGTHPENEVFIAAFKEVLK